MKKEFFVCFSLLFCIVLAIDIPYEWKLTNQEPNRDASITIMISLEQDNLFELERLFWERSNPKHNNYAQYLTRQEIANIIAPGGERENIVRNWFISNNIINIKSIETRDVLFVTATIYELEELFNVRFEVFQHIDKIDKFIYKSRVPYSLPISMKQHIQLISGINDFPPIMRKNRFRNNEKVENKLDNDVSTPTVSISGINARSQSPGTSIMVYVDYTCPSSLDCISQILVSITSANVNILYDTSMKQPVSRCSSSQCLFTIPVEYYVPLNISAIGLDSNDSPVTSQVFWEYATVANPHVVPQTLWELYSMTKNPLVTNPNSTVSVVEFEQQYYSQSDLDKFYVLMGLPSSEITVVGPNNETNPGGEANLDIQWAIALAPGANTFFWSVEAATPIEIDHILTWCYQMENYTNPPLVNSLSYGMTEGNVDKFLGQGYLNRTNTELQKLALQGLTIIIADGDVGSNDIGPPPMSQLHCYPSHPDWPSDSSYVTAIGSTFITPLSERICYIQGGSDCLYDPLGEVTVSVDMGMTWTTGGGFSNVTPRPSYQDDAVNAYLTNTSTVVPPSAYFNMNGRAYADAVTVGHNLEVVLSSELVAIDGTSASAPIFAGMVTVLNDARLNAGKTPLGFITPLMYLTYAEEPSCWNDITVGHNKCGAYGWKPVCCNEGFECTTGWDPVSGVGSPNIEQLKAYVLSLP